MKYAVILLMIVIASCDQSPVGLRDGPRETWNGNWDITYKDTTIMDTSLVATDISFSIFGKSYYPHYNMNSLTFSDSAAPNGVATKTEFDMSLSSFKADRAGGTFTGHVKVTTTIAGLLNSYTQPIAGTRRR